MQLRWFRPLAWLLAFMLATGALVPMVGAQDADPENGETITSITRAEYLEQVQEEFQFTEPEVEGGQVIYASSTDLATVNAIAAGDAPSFIIVSRIYESLVGGSAIDGQPVPLLADYWEIAPDGVTYTFYLNEDATWHDGEPFTASDVEFSFDMTLDEDTPSPYRTSVLEELESYQAIDDHTFEIVSIDRSATFLWNVPGTVSIMPRHLWEDVPITEWATDPGSTGQDPSRVVGTGPFRFVEWVVDDFARVERNDDYYVPELVPHIDEFIYNVVPDTAAAIQSLQTGEVDIVTTVDFAQVEAVDAIDGIRVDVFETFTFWYYLYNLDPAVTELFQDVEVRHALFHAIDRDAIAEGITFGYAEVAQGTHPTLSLAYAPDRMDETYDYDPERAVELLEEAGWELGDDGIREKDGLRLEFEWMSPSGIGEYEQLVAFIQESWMEIGVSIEPNFVPFPTLLDHLDAGDFEVMNLAFNWTASGDQTSMFNCEPQGGFNRMSYCNPEWDELNELQKRELDPEARIEILIEQANIAWSDLPVGILVFRDNRVGVNERLQNFVPNGFSEWWSLPYVWVDDD